MAVHSERVEVWLVQYRCDRCGLGEMIRTPDGRDGDEEGYRHVCSNCGVAAFLKEEYPYPTYSHEGQLYIRPGFARGSF